MVAAAGGSGVVVVSAWATTFATASLTGCSSQSVPGDCDTSDSDKRERETPLVFHQVYSSVTQENEINQ